MGEGQELTERSPPVGVRANPNPWMTVLCPRRMPEGEAFCSRTGLGPLEFRESFLAFGAAAGTRWVRNRGSDLPGGREGSALDRRA